MASCERMKRWGTRITVACFFLVGGIEYSVILPTMWDYLKSKGGKEWLYGVTLAAFSISNLITGPLYGLVFDKTHRTKLIVLFANVFEIGGNLMYFAANSKYMIMGSRFIVGLGAGAGAALFAELARTSSKKERTTIFSVFMSMRQIGLLVGPAFNLFLRIAHFYVGPFLVDKFTAPGALMMIIWIILEVMFVVFFYELPSYKEEEEEEKSHDKSPSHKSVVQSEHLSIGPSANTVKENSIESEVTKSTKDMFKNSHSVQVNPESSQSEKSPLLPRLSVQRTSSYNSNSNNQHKEATTKEIVSDYVEGSCWQGVKNAGSHLVWMISELLREEMVVLLAILFITMFSQTTTEAMLVPMTESLLGWTEFDNSIFFSAAGAEIIFAFILVSILSKFIGDRWQLIGGLLIDLFGYAWLIGFTGNATKQTPWILWKFIIGGIFLIFGLPLFGVTGASLYSKLLPPQIQGFGQGIRRSVFSTASILGPLWAGGSVTLSYYILLGVPCGLMLFVTLLLMLSFSKLKEHKAAVSDQTKA